MAVEFSVEGSYVIGDHDGWNEDDAFNGGFLRALPNSTERTVDPQTGKFVQPIPGPTKTIVAIVTAVLSSTALSRVIEIQLKKEPTKIEVTTTKGNATQKVVIENSALTASEIEKLLEELSGGDPRCNVRVQATKKAAPK